MCPDLYDPSYGRVNVTGNTPGYMAHYKCDHGYQLAGDNIESVSTLAIGVEKNQNVNVRDVIQCSQGM